MRIALFGGTFDPIHSGHVRLAKEFASRLGFDRVLLMPTFVPPHKLKSDMAPAQDRLAMCRLAAEEEPLLVVSDLEIRRGDQPGQGLPPAGLFPHGGRGQLHRFQVQQRAARPLPLQLRGVGPQLLHGYRGPGRRA